LFKSVCAKVLSILEGDKIKEEAKKYQNINLDEAKGYFNDQYKRSNHQDDDKDDDPMDRLFI